MKYGIIPSNLLERIALRSGKVPVPVVDALFGPLKTRAIMAGVSLGVFEAMRTAGMQPPTSPRRCGSMPTALELLLRTLVVCDYLVQHGERFALSPMARRTVIRDAPQQLVGYLRFNYAQWRFVGHLEELLRSGRGVDFHKR